MTGEQLEEVLLGESKVIDSNMRGRALRGGKINEEGNRFVAPGTVTYVGEGGADTGDFRDASTGIRTDIPYVASGPKTPEGAASIVASEAIRKKYQNQRPERSEWSCSRRWQGQWRLLRAGNVCRAFGSPSFHPSTYNL